MIKKTKPSSRILNISDYKIIREIRNGGFGIVYLVENRTSGQRLAAKVNIQAADSGELQSTMISREIGILIRVQAPTIIPFYGFSLKDFTGSSQVTLFMEYKENGSLQQLLEKERLSQSPHDYDNTAKQIILCGIAHGMMVLHSRRVIHRDLKPDNILLDSEYQPCITDFGLSKFLDPDNLKSQSMSGCGTTAYIAPEVFESNHYGPKADVYSFGILMFEVITGEEAFSDLIRNKKTNIISFGNKIINGERPKFPSMPIKPSLKKLIEQCWSSDPRERPTFKELFHKLSLSFEDDDDTIESHLKDILTQSEEEDEDFDYYKYCLENVDTDRVIDYVEYITNNNSNEKQLQQTIEDQKNEIEQLKQQNQQTIAELQSQIEELKKQNQQTTAELEKQIHKTTENGKPDIEQTIEELKRLNQATVEKLKTQHQQTVTELKNQTEKLRKQTEELKKQNQQTVVELKEKIEELERQNQQEVEKLRKHAEEFQKQSQQRIDEHAKQNKHTVEELTKRIEELDNQNQSKEADIRKQQIIISDLKKEISNSPINNMGNTNCMSFPFLSRTDDRGMFAFLLTNRIDHDNSKTIKITAFPDANNDQSTLNKIISEKHSSKAWCSKNDDNAYILFDFGSLSVWVNTFVVWTGDDRVNGRHMKSLRLSGSNDAKEFKHRVAFRRLAINGPSKSTFATITLSSSEINFYRYIKLELIEPNYKGTHEIYLQRIEFFGLININNEVHKKPAISIENTFSIPKLTAEDSKGICTFLLYNKVDLSNSANTIKITAFPDANNDQSTLDRIVASNNDKVWCSKDTPNGYIQFDFGKNSVAVSSLRIQTGDDPINGRHIQEVTFYGSNDGENWRELATWTDCNLNAPNAIINLVLNADNVYYYHYLKMQVKTNYKGTNELYLKRIEFFGNVQRIV